MKKILIACFCLFVVTLNCAYAGQDGGVDENSGLVKKLRSKKELFQSGSTRTIEPIDEYLDMSRLTVYGLIKEAGCADQNCPQNPSEYEWSVGLWNECLNESKHRYVKCVSVATRNEVADSLCSSVAKPLDNQSCGVGWNEDTNQYYVWLPSAFSQCDNQCGQGSKTRTAACYDKTFNKVDDNFCQGENPYSSVQECYSYEGCPYHWVTGEWGACLEGRKNRTVECKDNSGLVVSNDECYELDLNAPAKRSYDCEESGSYHWEYSDWGKCVMITTYDAYQYRTARCVDIDGKDAENDLCGSPSLQRSCAEWVLTNWSECSTSNTRTRQLYCGSPTERKPFDESSCAGLAKPTVALEESCTMSLYGWYAHPWEARCNEMPAIRNIECRQIFTGKTVADSYCDAAAKPNNQSNAWDENVPWEDCSYDLKLNDWQKCEMKDGRLQHKPIYACVKVGNGEATNQVVVDDNYCKDLIEAQDPEEQNAYQDCSYSWSDDPWSVCNPETLKKTRTVQCREEHGEVFNDSICTSLGEKPLASQDCELDFYWDYEYSLGDYYEQCYNREVYGSNRDEPLCSGYSKCPTSGSNPFRVSPNVCIAVEKGLDISTGHIVPDSVCQNNPSTNGNYEKWYMQCIYHPLNQSWPLPVSKCNAGCKKQGTRTWTINDCVWANYNKAKYWPTYPHQIEGYDAELCLSYSLFLENADSVPWRDDQFDESTYLSYVNKIPYINKSNIQYTNPARTSLTYAEACTGTCGGTWVVSGASQCNFNTHFSSGGLMNIVYGCKDPDSLNVITDENLMPCDPDTKPTTTEIGCYYNVSDPSEMTRINGLISQYVKDDSQFYNGEIVSGSELEVLMYNLNGYSNP